MNKVELRPCDKDGCDNIPEVCVAATEDPEVDDVIKHLCLEHGRTWVDFLLAHGINIIEICPSEYAL